MTLVSILFVLLAQGATPPAAPSDLVTIQAGASEAHKALRERLKGSPQCDPQSLTAVSTANRLATEATHRRRQVLAALQKAGERAVEPASPDPDGDELSKAVALLRKEMDASAALLAWAFPGEEIPASSMARPLAQATNMPPIKELAAATQGRAGIELPSRLASDLAVEESLTNAYFAAAKLEIERVCSEKPAPAADPFRVPAPPAKPSARKKGGQ